MMMEHPPPRISEKNRITKPIIRDKMFKSRIYFSWITVTSLSVTFILGALFIFRRRMRNPPLLRAPQKIFVISSSEEWTSVAEDFIRAISRLRIVGIDCEWVTSDQRSKVALLQLSPCLHFAVLLRLSHLNEVPREIVEMLSCRDIIKVGVAVLDDAHKLFEDYDIEVNNCLDLRYMAAFGDDHTVNSVGDFSLAGLARELAGISLNKADSLRCANWQAPALSNAEIEYAALDAHAGLAIALVILEKNNHSVWPFGQSLVDRCRNIYGIYIDIPFRKAALEGVTRKAIRQQRTDGPKTTRSKAKGLACTARREQTVYENSVLQAPDGEVLCCTNELKLKWYLKMGLGEFISDDPFTVRLNFEPRCRAILGGEFYVDTRPNQCVVCGGNENLLKKNVVPQQYRKHFPAIMKSHTSHDMVLLCVHCQLSYTKLEATFIAELDQKFPAPVTLPNFKAIKAAASGLLLAADKLPAERKEKFEQTVKEYLGLDDLTALTDDQLKVAASVDVRSWLHANNATHGKRIVQNYASAQGQGLFELEIIWRKYFLETMKPQHLPEKWSLCHNHDAVLMKIATGRDLSGLGVDELLTMLGVSWERMEDLLHRIVRDGLVPRENVVIWDMLEKYRN